MLRLLTASGEIVWTKGESEERVEEVARLALHLAQIPEQDGLAAQGKELPHAALSPARARPGRRAVRARGGGSQRLPISQSAGREWALSRWALAVAVASIILLVIVFALQRL